MKDSSDEEWCRDEDDVDDLPPFRWDCFYDGGKALGFPSKRRYVSFLFCFVELLRMIET